jgi:mersacidin/lichenicidin family type 2 lantibiotic
MNHEQIIRAWKDSAYRNSLNTEEQALLPASPAGVLLTDAELESVVGQIALSFWGCTYNQYNFYTNGTNIVGSSNFSVYQNNYYGD